MSMKATVASLQLGDLDPTLPQWRIPNNNPETDVMLRVQCLSAQEVKVPRQASFASWAVSVAVLHLHAPQNSNQL